MATAAKTGPQDMPPPGGYNPIQTARVRLKTIFTAPRVAVLFIASQVYGWYNMKKYDTQVRKHDIEMQSAKQVIFSFLRAEMDREYLKNLRRNREHERDLMKNNPDWELGTYYGEPIFKTIDLNETWYDQKYGEYLCHTYEDFYKIKDHARLWT